MKKIFTSGTLFSDTIRNNLDPLLEFTDEEIWNTLRQVELSETVTMLPGSLDYLLTEKGNNLSVGEKQLYCLARALLKRNKILIIDEATANVDPRYINNFCRGCSRYNYLLYFHLKKCVYLTFRLFHNQKVKEF